MVDDLERRAEELIDDLYSMPVIQQCAKALIEQLLSENRQVRERKSRTNDTKSHVELDLPARLRDAVLAWLSSNEKAGSDVRWGAYPHGMVQRWIERAEAAEARVREEIAAHEATVTTRNILGRRNDELLSEVASLRQQLEHDQGALAAQIGYKEEVQAEVDRISAEREAYREAIDTALHELGEPQPGYPAPVANAVEALRRILAENDR